MRVIDQICAINQECFTSDDPYSSVGYAQQFSRLVVKVEGKVVGYILYQVLPTHIESLRRAVTKEYRGIGIGSQLTKRLTKIADKQGKDIFTYVSKSNLASLNSNFKCGYRITDIAADWVYITYKHKGS